MFQSYVENIKTDTVKLKDEFIKWMQLSIYIYTYTSWELQSKQTFADKFGQFSYCTHVEHNIFQLCSNFIMASCYASIGLP